MNAIRAEMSAAVKVTNPRLLDKIPQIRGEGHEALSKADFREVFKRKAPKPTHLKMLTGQVMTNVFIHTTTSDALPPKLVKESGRRGRIAKATVSIDDLPRLANDKRVRFVELGEPLKTPQPLDFDRHRQRSDDAAREDHFRGASQGRQRRDHRHHRRAGFRLRASGLPRCAGQHPLSDDLGPGRRCSKPA